MKTTRSDVPITNPVRVTCKPKYRTKHTPKSVNSKSPNNKGHKKHNGTLPIGIPWRWQD